MLKYILICWLFETIDLPEEHVNILVLLLLADGRQEDWLDILNNRAEGKLEAAREVARDDIISASKSFMERNYDWH